MPTTERMTLTDMADHVGVSRVTMYKLAGIVDFPKRGVDRKWSRSEVLEWLAANSEPVKAVLVAGVLVRVAAE